VVYWKNWVEKNGEECRSSYMPAGFVFIVDYSDGDFVLVRKVKVAKGDAKL
jgi:hypothetical protein